jgi:hypothetical protein
MAQTTGAFAQSGFKVEVSLNGSDWTDISGQATNVAVEGGDQMVGEQHTADGEVPVVTGSNKTEAKTVTVSILYTETNGEAFQIVNDRYDGADKTIYLRYSPAGGGTGDKRWVCANAAGNAIAVPIINCLPPEVDAGTGDPAMAEFSVRTPDLKKETIS